MDSTADLPPDRQPGLAHVLGTIGRYHLLRVIGEGGFGVVYEAEQLEPVRRRVALKLIRPGMDSGAVIARFQAERQALAVMDHPCIAKVFDGGVAGVEHGSRPYFVMELVRGDPITAHCDKQQLTIDQRVDLFVRVCEAVQHAHTKGVVHRDLKPSNILVSYDTGGGAEPKIIDFGVAKALNQRLSERTIFTERGQLIGTPEYMSPEQAEMSGQDVDTRADVYSLGVVLYELLTGVLPFDSKALREAGYNEIQRIIRESEPPKPSTRLGTMLASDDKAADLRGIVRARRTDARSIAGILRRDLDWVVMRCLEKERERRYQSATALGQDLRRYLSGETVEAGPPSARYRASKFAGRHRVLLAAGTAVSLALVAGLGVATLGFVRASRDRDAALAAKNEAEAAAGFLADVLVSADPSERGRDVTVRQVLDRASLRIEERFGAHPMTEAVMHRAIGRAYFGLGYYADAERHLSRAYALRREHLGEDHAETMSALVSLTGLRYRMGQAREAEATYRDLLTRASATLGGDHQVTLATMNNLAQLLGSTGRAKEAAAMQARAVAVYKVSVGPDHEDTLGAMANLARMEADAGNFDAALALHEEALAAWKRRQGEDGPGTLLAAHNLGVFYLDTHRLDMAEAVMRGVVERRMRVLGADHPDTIGTRTNLGIVLTMQGKVEEAEAILSETYARSRALLGEKHELVSGAADHLLTCLEAQGWPARAEAVTEELVAYQRARVEDADARPWRLNALAWTLLTVEPERLRDAPSALAASVRACADARASGDPDLWQYLDTLALALSATGDHAGAATAQREAISLIPPGDEGYRGEMQERLDGYEAAISTP